jgi:chaperonin GroEL
MAVAAVGAAGAGVVPGAGVVLLRLATTVESGSRGDTVEEAARRMLAVALRRCPRTLLFNAGLRPEAWLGRLAEAAEQGMGLDGWTGTMANVVSAGIVDPLTVVVGALERSVSAAAVLLRADGIIA